MTQTDSGLSVHKSDRAALAVLIESLLARIQSTVALERRRADRAAIPYLFSITPLDPDWRSIDDEEMVVVGKNLSRQGISFYHERPLSHRRARIELVQPGLGGFAAEIDIKWCRFSKPGWYESGGRLVRATLPSERAEEADAVPAPPMDFYPFSAQISLA